MPSEKGAKLISFYLLDGVADGRVVCDIHNRTGKACKIPRNLLKDCANREELKKPGVYVLFGRDENDPESRIAYIGEAEEVWKRLTQHQDKDFWTEAVVFISKDENLNKAHIKFLEYSIYDAASTAKRCRLENANIPSCPALAEAEQAVMVELLEDLKLLVGTMGYRIFEPLSGPSQKRAKEYRISAARGANAKALITSEGVVVTEGSEVATPCVQATAPATVALRERLLKEGVIARHGDKLRFTKDYLFPTPSTAAAVVMGRIANGRIAWKDSAGHTLKDNEEATQEQVDDLVEGSLGEESN